MEHLLKDLNEQQKIAVTYGDGPLLILAGAGSGKTRVITYRIAYLIKEKKVDPRHILAVTFTNKAAQEMRERVVKLVGSKSRDIWVSTFHSSCVRILRKEIQVLGYTKDFVIYDTDDSERLVKECVLELNKDEKALRPRTVLGTISGCKNELIGPQEYEDSADTPYQQNAAKIYQLYEKKLKANNALDFDNIISLTIRVFREHPEVLRRWQDRFPYIMVDEYQDINTAQYVLTQLLAARRLNLTVVGDEDQSIYRFRGADIRNILRFEEDYPGTKLIKLEQNYRSYGFILKAAWMVIKNNTQRKDKVLWTARGEGEKVKFLQTVDEREEAGRVVSEIQRVRMREARPCSDFVVLYRTNAQSRNFEDALRMEGVSYIVIGGVSFYERMEIKDVLAYLRLLVNPLDSVSLMRIINVPSRGLGDVCVGRVREFCFQAGINLYHGLGRAKEISGLSPRQLESLTGFYQLLEDLRQKTKNASPFEVVKEMLEKSSYLKYWQADDSSEAKNRAENVKELVNAIKDYEEKAENPTLSGFLEQVALVQDVDKLTDKTKAVTLMTIHNAKGLEFPYVFLTGMEEGLFPHNNSINEDFGIEEERRLCYVGMTRAREKLYLTASVQRRSYGNPVWNPVSRFVEEIDPALLEEERGFVGRSMPVERFEENLRIKQKIEEGFEPQPTFITDENQEAPSEGDEAPLVKVSLGDRVVHPEFGRGTVISKTGKGDKAKAVVSFLNAGRKNLLLKYAKLKKM